MKTRNLLIAGGALAVGAGAFFWWRNRKSATDSKNNGQPKVAMTNPPAQPQDAWVAVNTTPIGQTVIGGRTPTQLAKDLTASLTSAFKTLK